MTHFILIAADDEVTGRWREAFPGGCAVPGVREAAARMEPGALVWLHLPNDTTAATGLVSRARALFDTARLVALSDTPSDEQALELMEHGAVGYCHSRAGPAMLQQVATVVGNEGLWVGPNLLQRLIRASLPALPAASSVRLDALSVREREVAEHVGRGSSNKEIARALDITERTVKAHLSAIFMKLGVRDRLHLALLMRSA